MWFELLITYTQGAAFAMSHKLMHKLIEPALLILLQSDKVVLVKYESLIAFVDKWSFGVDVVHEVSMDSLRRPRKLSQLTISK